MKKFEQELKQKAHLSKIRNAKKTVPLPGKNSHRVASKKNGEEAQLLIRLYDNKSYDSIPAYKLLRTAGLQQYTRGFIERGYGINLGKLGLLSEKQKTILFEEIKVLPGHAVKLDKLILSLTKHSIEPSQFDESTGSASQVGRKFTPSVTTPEGGSKKTQRHSNNDIGTKVSLNLNYQKDSPTGSKTGQFTHNVAHFGSDYDTESQYQKQLARVLNEYTPDMGGDHKKQTYDFKRNSKISQNLPKITSVGPNRKISSGVPAGKPFMPIATTGQDFKKKGSVGISAISGKPTVKKVQKDSGRTSQSQRIIKRIAEGVDSDKYNKTSTSSIMDLDLGINKIRNLSRSFQGALMGSTIANIDIEELVYAFSGFVESKVVPATPETSPFTITGINKIINQRSEASQPMEESQQIPEDSIDDQVGNILRESYLHPLYRNQQIDEDIEDQDIGEREEQEEDLVESQGEEDGNSNQFMQNAEENLAQSSVSSFLGGQSYQFGLAQPLKIFDQPDPSQLDYFKPTIDSISNFIKNIVLAAKMERQISIMAAYYLEQFLKKTNLSLTSLNYKRILVTVLLLASKIWDDESFQSPSFSRTFPEYTTILLNQMQKQVLNALDYKLKLQKKEYAGIFFRMRQYARKNARSYQNKRLDLKRIRELQMGIKRDYKSSYMEKRNSF